MNIEDAEVLLRSEYDPDVPTIGAYIPGEADGAYPNGTRVVKVEQEEEDGTPLGMHGVVLASHAIPADVPEMTPGREVRFFYFVKWDDFPFPVGMCDWKIGKADAL